jgi:hypothetical protein
MNILNILFMTLITAIIIVPIAVIGMSIFVPRENIMNILERLMVLLQAPFDFIRNILRQVTQFIWNNMIVASLSSVGVIREHWIQRLLGAIIFPLIFATGLVVLLMNNILTLGGIFGSDLSYLQNYIPVNVEVLMAIELVASIFASGAMILDVLGVSHFLKYISKETLNIPLRWVVGSILSVMFIGGVYLCVILGILRTEMIYAGENNTAQVETMENKNSEILLPDNNLSTEDELIKENTNSLVSQTNSNESEKNYTNIVMVGVPVVSNVTGFFAGLGIIPLGAILIVIPLFLTQIIIGLFYQLFALICRVIDLVYNFMISVFNSLILIGQAIGNRIRSRSVNKEANNGLAANESIEQEVSNTETIRTVDNDVNNTSDKNSSISNENESSVNNRGERIENEDEIEIIPENTKSFNPLS